MADVRPEGVPPLPGPPQAAPSPIRAPGKALDHIAQRVLSGEEKPEHEREALEISRDRIPPSTEAPPPPDTARASLALSRRKRAQVAPQEEPPSPVDSSKRSRESAEEEELHEAARSEKRRLAQAIHDPNEIGPDGSSYLTRALQDNDMEMFEMLLDRLSLSSAVRTDQEWRPLIELAVSLKNEKALKMMREHGANLNALDQWGNTLVTNAVFFDKIAVLEFLRDNKDLLGIDFSKPNGDGYTCITYAAWCGNVPALEFLRDNKDLLGIDFSKPDSKRRTPATSAADVGETEALQFLLANKIQLGIDFSKPDGKGRTPAMLVVIHNQREALKFLCENKASLGISFSTLVDGKNSPIMHALLRENQECIELLKRYGEDIEFAQALLDQKRMAQIWGLRGTITVKTRGHQMRVNLEGFDERKQYDYFQKLLVPFLASMPQHPHFGEPEKQIIRNALQPLESSASELLKHIQTHPLLMPVSLRQDQHTIGIVLSNKRIMICNRGWGGKEQPIEMYSIDLSESSPIPEKQREAFIQKLKDLGSIEDLDALLKEYLCQNEGTILQKWQSSDNCTWANLESALFALLNFVLEKDIPDSAKPLTEARSIYKAFTTQARLSSLDQYLSDPTKPLGLDLTQKFLKKLKKLKNKGYITPKQHLSYIEKMLNKLVQEGIRLNDPDTAGRTLATRAARDGDTVALQILHERGVDLSKPDSNKNTPLSSV